MFQEDGYVSLLLFGLGVDIMYNLAFRFIVLFLPGFASWYNMLRKETSDHMLQDIIQILEVHPLRLCLGIWGEREGEGFDDKGRSKENGE